MGFEVGADDFLPCPEASIDRCAAAKKTDGVAGAFRPCAEEAISSRYGRFAAGTLIDD